MSRSTAPSSSSELIPDQSAPPQASAESVLGRRGLLRGAALAGAAAGVAVVGAAGSATTAHAADGDPVTLGAENSSATTTRITVTEAENATLALTNENGPCLSLFPLLPDWQGELGLGEIVNTDAGPLMGVETRFGPTTTILATGVDLEDLPTPFAVDPVRLIDTRVARDRAEVPLRTSPDAFDSTGRLRAGAWMDVGIALDDGHYTITAAHLNVAVTGPLRGGFASVYPPPTFRGTSTLNFAANQTIANAAFTKVTVVEGVFAVRVLVSVPAYVFVDFSGGAVQGRSALPVGNAKAAKAPRAAASRSRLVSRVVKALTR